MPRRVSCLLLVLVIGCSTEAPDAKKKPSQAVARSSTGKKGTPKKNTGKEPTAKGKGKEEPPKEEKPKTREEQHEAVLAKVDAWIEKAGKEEEEKTRNRMKLLTEPEKVSANIWMEKARKKDPGRAEAYAELNKLNCLEFVRLYQAKNARGDKDFMELLQIIWRPTSKLATAEGYLGVMALWESGNLGDHFTALGVANRVQKDGIKEAGPPEHRQALIRFGGEPFLLEAAGK